LFAACVTLLSGGDRELFKPLTDDDHTDVTAGRHSESDRTDSRES
jgi:hypothetical protein